MATSFITGYQRDLLASVLSDLRTTFQRPITIFQTAKETIVSTNPEHNFLFNNAPTNDVVQEVIQSGVYQAGILYGRTQPLNPIAVGRTSPLQPGIQLEEGEARLRLDPTGAAVLASCERVRFDGNVLRVVTTPRPHGLFDPKFYDFYLKRLN